MAFPRSASRVSVTLAGRGTRGTQIRRASELASKGFRPRPMALLPPIPLYRRLLRAHRKLPPEMRVLGDDYVRAEFRAHRGVENPAHLIGFLTEWQLYAQKIEGDAWVGEKLDLAKLEKMSDDQLAQLYELMKALRKRDSDGDAGQEGKR